MHLDVTMIQTLYIYMWFGMQTPVRGRPCIWAALGISSCLSYQTVLCPPAWYSNSSSLSCKHLTLGPGILG
jgi:hypothetical protein